MIHTLVIDLHFVCIDDADSDQAFEAFADRVFNELVKLQEVDPGIIDPDLTAQISKRMISLMVGIDASTLRDATRLFLDNVRCALHAADCVTAEWPSYELADEDFPPVREADYVA